MTVEEAALRLSREERLRLIEKLRDSLAADSVEITDGVHAKLEHRLAAHRRDPGATLSWAEVKRRLREGE